MAVAVGAEVAALQVVVADSRVVAATPAVGAVVVAEINPHVPVSARQHTSVCMFGKMSVTLTGMYHSIRGVKSIQKASDYFMTIETHHVKGNKIAEVLATDRVINSIEDGLHLLGELYYQDFDKIIIHEKNITPEFFDLKSGIAGEILQKFSNYRVQLAIIGDFSKYSSKSIQDFIYESNKGRQISFVGSLLEAIRILSIN
jgi:hypothetical protein